jgi:serpin B
VDEQGTEAAAATSVGMYVSMPPQFRFDRPFLFAIRERLSGAVLFVGVIGDPTA